MIRLPSLAMFLLASLAFAAPAGAGDRAPATEDLMLMEVEGKIVIGTDGIVQSAVLTTERVTSPLRESLIAKAELWRFRPLTVQGKPALVETTFSATLAATPDGDQYKVWIDSIQFRVPEGSARPDGMRTPITGKDMTPPRYPAKMLMGAQSGRVRLAVLVGANGRAEKVDVVQSLSYDLTGAQVEATAARTIRAMEANAIAAARGWSFNVPPELAGLGVADRTVTVPVAYVLLQYDVSRPGYWIPVKRGPRHVVAWLPPERTADLALGAGGSGSPVALDSPFRMLKPAAGTVLQ